jgi:hypothetical protein
LGLRFGRQLPSALESSPGGFCESLPPGVVVVVVVGGRPGSCPGAAGAETAVRAVVVDDSPVEDDDDEMDLCEMKRFHRSLTVIVGVLRDGLDGGDVMG